MIQSALFISLIVGFYVNNDVSIKFLLAFNVLLFVTQFIGFGVIYNTVKPEKSDQLSLQKINNAILKLNSRLDSINISSDKCSSKNYQENYQQQNFINPHSEVFREILLDTLQEYFSSHPNDSSVAQAAIGPDSNSVVNEKSPVHIDSSAREEALLGSNNIVDEALASGVWTNEDNKRLLKNSAFLSFSDKTQLMHKLYTALQNKQLVIEEGDDPPFL